MAGPADVGILNPEEIERLAEAGIRDLAQVLEAINEPHERHAASRLTGISEEALWQLACIADLCRIPGLGPKRALLLSRVESACTVANLAECDPHDLRSRLAEQSLSPPPTIPSLRQLRAYIDRAQTTAPLLQPTSGPSQVDRQFEATIDTQVSNVWQQIRVFGVICALVLAALWTGLVISAYQLVREMGSVLSVLPTGTAAVTEATKVLGMWTLSVPAVAVGLLYAFFLSQTLLSIWLYRLVNRLAFRSRHHKALAIDARRASMKAYDLLKAWVHSHLRLVCGLMATILVAIILVSAVGTPLTENLDIREVLAIVGPVMFVAILAVWIIPFRSELREVRKIEGWSRSFERRFVLSEVAFDLALWSIFGLGIALVIWLEVDMLGSITIRSYYDLEDAVSGLTQFVAEGPDQAAATLSLFVESSADEMRLVVEVVKAGLPQAIWKAIAWWLALTFALALTRLVLIQGSKALIFIVVSAALGWMWEVALVERLPAYLGIGRGSLLAWAVRLTFIPLGFFITDYVYEWVAAEEATCPACGWDTEREDRYCPHCGSRLDRFAESATIRRRLDRLLGLIPFLRRKTRRTPRRGG